MVDWYVRARSVLNDKDGVVAGSVFAEMAGYLQRVHGRTVLQQLEHLWGLHGQWVTVASYIFCRQVRLVDVPWCD